MNTNLATYLHDHLAGANMAIDLIAELGQQQHEESTQAFLRRLLLEVTADRDALQELANEVHAGSSVVKNSAALIAAKALDLKLGAGKTPFGLFESFEFLALGILGKLHLWKALQMAETHSGTDFTPLIERAKGQHAEVERYRLSTAIKALR
jgi:hypothetical protein